MLADDLRSIAEWLEDEQRDLIERAPSVASGMYERAQILWAIAARLEGLATEIQGHCGKWNPYMDCSAYLDRQMTCPECPAHLMDWLDKEADHHG